MVQSANPHQVMLLECSAPHWLDVVSMLSEQGASPVYWTAWLPLTDAIRTRFPSCVVHDSLDAKRAISHDRIDGVRGAFDEVCAELWRTETTTVFDMMNRFDTSRDMTNVDRENLYMQMLVYWRANLSLYKPDIVIFPAPPHVVYDYVVLCLCRLLGIRTIMFEEATIVPPYRIEMEDYLKGDPKLRAVMSQPMAISRGASEIASRLRGDYERAKPSREVEAHRRMSIANQRGLKGFAEQIASVFEVDKAHGGTYSINPKIVNVTSFAKERGNTVKNSFEGIFANTKYMLQRYEERLQTERLSYIYSQLCEPLESVQSPFVYIPLAGQPERTSSPQAGIFANQLLMVNVVSHSLPHGWTVVVKEHPNQFHPEFETNMCRSEEYYFELASIPNVSIVSTGTDPFELIDRCSAIATTGGTTTLEGIARGKPALLFGNAWYRDCPGVNMISGIEEAKRCLQSLPLVPKDALERFVEGVMTACKKGIADYPPTGYEMDEKENINNLFQSVSSALQSARLS